MQTPGTLPPFDLLLLTAPDAKDSVRSQHSTLDPALDREQIADNLHLHRAKCFSDYVEFVSDDGDVTANNDVMMMMVVT